MECTGPINYFNNKKEAYMGNILKNVDEQAALQVRASVAHIQMIRQPIKPQLSARKSDSS